MYSVNAPVPGRVAALASELRPALAEFDAVRERHTLVVKRLGEEDGDRLEKRVRRALSGAPAVEAHIAEIGAFEEPAAGPGPVVYLAVESPGLIEIHRRLCRTVEPVSGIEGEDYVPHVTLARGGSTEAVERLRAVEFEPVSWTVGELVFWEARVGEPWGRISLPG